MHSSAKRNLERFFSVYYKNNNYSNSVLNVLDFGSRNLNENWSTCKSILKELNLNFNYTGADIVSGHNVDIVIKQPYHFNELGNNSFDIVLATSVFEHVEFFWLTYLEIIRVLKPNGIFYLNSPSNGDFHRYNVDCWRFYPDASIALVNWGNKNGNNSILLESFISKQYLECGWNDFVAIILKDKNHIKNYNQKIIHQYPEYVNGLDNNLKLHQFSNKTEDHSSLGWKISYKIRKKLHKLLNKNK